MRKIIILVLAFLVACGDGRLSPQGGTLTGVSAGSGVTGGGTAGNVAVNVGAGSGMLVSADLVSIDEAYTQRRVGATCAAGSSIREIAVDGTVTCEADDLGGGVGDGDKGDISVTGGGGVWTIDNAVVTFAKQADIATSRFVGRVTAGTGVQEALTGTQATTLLDVFTTALKGLVPASGGGTVNYLRADGTFAAPPGTYITAVSSDFTVSSGTLDMSTNVTLPGDLTLAGGNLALGGGNILASTGTSFLGDLRGTVISPTALAANTDDWAPTSIADAMIIRIDASTPVNLTGITTGAAGRLLIMHNISANTVTLVNDATSTAANRFLGTANVPLLTNQAAVLVYDAVASRWRITVSPPSTSVAAGSITTTELADNLDLSTNGSTTVGDFRGKVQALTNGTGVVAGSQAINADTMFYRATAGSPTQINGITATGRADGSILCVYMVSGVIQLNHENAGAATAADRFNLPNGASWYFQNGGGCLVYDATATRWKLYSFASAQFPTLAVSTTLANTGAITSTMSSTANILDLSAVYGTNSATYNATAAARASYGVRAVNTATKSAGANTLTNYGIYASGSGGDVNYAGWFQGDVNVTGTLTAAGNTTLGDGSNDIVTITGRTVNTYTSVAGAISRRGIDSLMSGTFDTTAAARTSFAVYADNTSTISAGANDLTNYGIYATASGAGAVNWAGWFQGDFAATGNMTLGTSTANVITVAGDVLIDDVLQAYGNTTLGDAVTDLVSIAGDITVADVATFNSTVNLGDADTDIVEINGKISIAVSSLGFQDKTPAPTFGACGTSPSATTGGNFAMTVTVGTGTATSCAVNFADTFAASPTCVMSSRTGTRQDAYLSAVSSSAFTISNVAGANMASAVFDIICVGH